MITKIKVKARYWDSDAERITSMLRFHSRVVPVKAPFLAQIENKVADFGGGDMILDAWIVEDTFIPFLWGYVGITTGFYSYCGTGDSRLCWIDLAGYIGISPAALIRTVEGFKLGRYNLDGWVKEAVGASSNPYSSFMEYYLKSGGGTKALGVAEYEMADLLRFVKEGLALSTSWANMYGLDMARNETYSEAEIKTHFDDSGHTSVFYNHTLNRETTLSIADVCEIPKATLKKWKSGTLDEKVLVNLCEATGTSFLDRSMEAFFSLQIKGNMRSSAHEKLYDQLNQMFKVWDVWRAEPKNVLKVKDQDVNVLSVLGLARFGKENEFVDLVNFLDKALGDELDKGRWEVTDSPAFKKALAATLKPLSDAAQGYFRKAFYEAHGRAGADILLRAAGGLVQPRDMPDYTTTLGSENRFLSLPSNAEKLRTVLIGIVPHLKKVVAFSS